MDALSSDAINQRLHPDPHSPGAARGCRVARHCRVKSYENNAEIKGRRHLPARCLLSSFRQTGQPTTQRSVSAMKKHQESFAETSNTCVPLRTCHHVSPILTAQAAGCEESENTDVFPCFSKLPGDNTHHLEKSRGRNNTCKQKTTDRIGKNFLKSVELKAWELRPTGRPTGMLAGCGARGLGLRITGALPGWQSSQPTTLPAIPANQQPHKPNSPANKSGIRRLDAATSTSPGSEPLRLNEGAALKPVLTTAKSACNQERSPSGSSPPRAGCSCCV